MPAIKFLQRLLAMMDCDASTKITDYMKELDKIAFLFVQVFNDLMQLHQNLQMLTCLHISTNKVVPHVGREPCTTINLLHTLKKKKITLLPLQHTAHSLKVIQSKYIKNECELVK